MSTSQLLIIVGVISALLVFPLLVMLLVRVLIPLKEPTGAAATEEEPPLEFTSLRDFWESNVPHLRELRDRIFKALVCLALATGLGFWVVNSAVIFGRSVPEWLVDHFVTDPSIQVQTTAVAEEFVGYMRIALVIGVAISFPFVLYQIIAFLAPALHAGEKRILFTALPFVTELFVAGLAFGWFFTIPAAMGFLLGFGNAERIVTQPTLSSFLEIVSSLLIWNAVVFELPAVIYLLARLGLVQTATLISARRYALVVIVIFAAIITPTGDPYNLLLLAAPMYLLYELGIILTRFVPKRQPDQLAA